MEKIEIDRTDEERVEQVKEWINDYWKTIAFAVLVAGGVVYGLNYYKAFQLAKIEASAEQLSDIKKDLEGDKLNEAGVKLATLQDKEPTSSFSVVASFTTAQNYFEKGDFTEAAKQYDWVINYAPDEALKDIARIRKAKVFVSDKKSDEALTLLNSLQTKTFSAQVTMLKGDILLSLEKFDEAIKAYESVPKEDSSTPLLQQRIDLANIKKQQADS